MAELMKVLRTTMWSPDLEPTTIFMRASDLRFPIEEAATDEPGMFLIHDVFEADDDVSIEKASFAGMERFRLDEENERNQAIAYYHWGQMLKMVTSGGMVVASKPAPLDRSEMEVVLRQLQRHPNYRDQAFTVAIKGGKILSMNKDGEVSEVDPGSGR